MASSPSTRARRPTWEVADLLLPYQGDWTVEEYLKLNTNRLIEFTDGSSRCRERFTHLSSGLFSPLWKRF
jgi:hypothetical protein